MRPRWPIRGQGWPPLPQVLGDGVGILEDFQHFWVLMRDKYVTIPQLPSPAVWRLLSKIHVFPFFKDYILSKAQGRVSSLLKICQFKWDYDKVEIQMFWSLQVTRDALWGCKKVSAFPEKLVCKDRPMSYKNAQYTRYYLHLFSLSKPQFLTARSLGKARARYLFQWMLFEKGQNFKSRRPFRPDLCPVLLVNHWRKILVCISPFFQSFYITGHLAPAMPSAKIAPIWEKLFTSA